MKYYTRVGDVEREFTFERVGDRLLASNGERTYDVDLASLVDGAALSLLVDGRSYDVILEPVGRGDVAVQIHGERMTVTVEDERERTASTVAGQRGTGKQELLAAMPGIVVDVKVATGDAVAAGETVLVLEAMKMQNPLTAEQDGVVAAVHVAIGDTVAGGAILVEIEPPPPE